MGVQPANMEIVSTNVPLTSNTLKELTRQREKGPYKNPKPLHP